ncbi:hypothetical protein L1765_10220 [Microaerobacter geothermalis]|nr:hypothetical protein [Microaerobacter geothermalis]
MDIQLEMLRVPVDSFWNTSHQEESSETIRNRVLGARERQNYRFSKENIEWNGDMDATQVKKYAILTKEANSFLKEVYKKLSLSGRGLHRIIKLARTIADLAQKEKIETEHVAEAVQYRELDRKLRV